LKFYRPARRDEVSNMQTKSLRIGGPALAIIFAMILVSPAVKAQTVLFRGTPGQAVVAQMMLDLQHVAMKAGELTYLKREFSEEIASARQRVRASCASGARDQVSEASLVGLLRDKDLYYLFFLHAVRPSCPRRDRSG
jgi:hypothetical protein